MRLSVVGGKPSAQDLVTANHLVQGLAQGRDVLANNRGYIVELEQGLRIIRAGGREFRLRLRLGSGRSHRGRLAIASERIPPEVHVQEHRERRGDHDAAQPAQQDHAAIVAREFGIPAIVGCADATRLLEPLQEVTGTCAEGDEGLVFDGLQPFDIVEVEADDGTETRTGVKLNVGFPGKALQDAWVAQQVPQCGYCQSGQIMQAADLLGRNANPSDSEIASALP